MADLSGKYLAFVLDVESRNKLLSEFLPMYDRFVCHHITIEYDNVTQELVDAFVNNQFVVRTTRHIHLNGVECFAIRFNGDPTRPDNKKYHLTYSLADGKQAVESVNVVESEEGEFIIAGNQLTGTFQLLEKKPSMKAFYASSFETFINKIRPQLGMGEIQTLAAYTLFLESGDVTKIPGNYKD